MLRAATWTVGLFAAGSAVCHFFPETWVEPLVLLALGAALLLVSSRPGRPSGAAAPPRSSKQAA